MSFAKADVAIRVDNTRQNTGLARYVLCFSLYGLYLRPLQHRLNDRAKASLLTISPDGGDVIIEFFILLQSWTFQRRILAVSANDRKIVVFHRRTIFVQIFRQAPDFVHVLVHRNGIGVNTEPGFVPLELREHLVGFHRFRERFGISSETIVILGCAVERYLANEELQCPRLKDLPKLSLSSIGEVGVGRNVDLLNVVVLDEERADFGEFRADEWFAARQIEVFEIAQLLR